MSFKSTVVEDLLLWWHRRTEPTRSRKKGSRDTFIESPQQPLQNGGSDVWRTCAKSNLQKVPQTPPKYLSILLLSIFSIDLGLNE